MSCILLYGPWAIQPIANIKFNGMQRTTIWNYSLKYLGYLQNIIITL